MTKSHYNLSITCQISLPHYPMSADWISLQQRDIQLGIGVKENLPAFEKFIKFISSHLPERMVDNHKKGNERISMKESPAYTL